MTVHVTTDFAGYSANVGGDLSDRSVEGLTVELLFHDGRQSLLTFSFTGANNAPPSVAGGWTLHVGADTYAFSAGSYGSASSSWYWALASVTWTHGQMITVYLTRPMPPTVSVTADRTTVAPNGPVSLTATASDPDGGSVTYAWSQTSGPAGTFDATDQSTVTWTAPSTTGSAVIQVIVTDDESDTATATVTISVQEAVQPRDSKEPVDDRPLKLALWTDKPGYRAGETVRLYRTTEPRGDRDDYEMLYYLERAGAARGATSPRDSSRCSCGKTPWTIAGSRRGPTALAACRRRTGN